MPTLITHTESRTWLPHTSYARFPHTRVRIACVQNFQLLPLRYILSSTRERVSLASNHHPLSPARSRPAEFGAATMRELPGTCASCSSPSSSSSGRGCMHAYGASAAEKERCARVPSRVGGILCTVHIRRRLPAASIRRRPPDM